MLQQALMHINNASHTFLRKLKTDRFMAGANWEKIETHLPANSVKMYEASNELLIHECRKRLLNRERSIYWEQFEEGILSANALRELSGIIDIMLDNNGRTAISERKDIEYLLKPTWYYSILKPVYVVRNYSELKYKKN